MSIPGANSYQVLNVVTNVPSRDQVVLWAKSTSAVVIGLARSASPASSNFRVSGAHFISINMTTTVHISCNQS